MAGVITIIIIYHAQCIYVCVYMCFHVCVCVFVWGYHTAVNYNGAWRHSLCVYYHSWESHLFWWGRGGVGGVTLAYCAWQRSPNAGETSLRRCTLITLCMWDRTFVPHFDAPVMDLWTPSPHGKDVCVKAFSLLHRAWFYSSFGGNT